MMTELEFYAYMIVAGIGYCLGFVVARYSRPLDVIQIESEWNDHG